MNIKFRNLLLPLMAGAIAFSCDKNDSTDITPESAITSEATQNASSDITYNETFEGSSVFSSLHKQFGTSHAFNVSSHAANGSKSGRFELRDSDPIQSGGTRAEVLFPEMSYLNRWYGFSVYFPAADYAKDSYTEIINQWHQGGGTSPSIALEIKGDRYNVVIPSNATSTGKSERIDIGPVTKDVWNRFAIHINHSSGSDGVLEIWLNGKKILNRTGANMYPLSSSPKPRWKLGIYKWKWNDNMTTDVKKRVLYFDDIKVGNGNATLSDMMSGASSSTSAPAPTSPEAGTTAPAPTAPVAGTTAPAPTAPSTSTDQSVASLTLVDASADKDVMTFTNGATLDLSALGVRKFNVRANTSTSTVGSVKFELSGAQSRTYTDSQFPYSVQGDDGAGNYYFGKWELPYAAGSYTLKVTPYSGSNGSGTAGATTTINFTVK